MILGPRQKRYCIPGEQVDLPSEYILRTLEEVEQRFAELDIKYDKRIRELKWAPREVMLIKEIKRGQFAPWFNIIPPLPDDLRSKTSLLNDKVIALESIPTRDFITETPVCSTKSIDVGVMDTDELERYLKHLDEHWEKLWNEGLESDPATIELIPEADEIDRDKWPSDCLKCGNPCYNGASAVDCSNKDCK